MTRNEGYFINWLLAAVTVALVVGGLMFLWVATPMKVVTRTHEVFAPVVDVKRCVVPEWLEVHFVTGGDLTLVRSSLVSMVYPMKISDPRHTRDGNKAEKTIVVTQLKSRDGFINVNESVKYLKAKLCIGGKKKKKSRKKK